VADKPVAEVVNVDAVIDALSPSPTSSDVYEATLPFNPHAVAASAVRRAGEGGASFPATWTVDPSGALTVEMLVDATTLGILQAAGATQSAILVKDGDGDTYFRVSPTGCVIGETDALAEGFHMGGGFITLYGDAGNDANFTLRIQAGQKLGFYGTAPVVRPNVPAVPTAQDVVDALVTLGLVTQS
jgi:hypothetical protein